MVSFHLAKATRRRGEEGRKEEEEEEEEGEGEEEDKTKVRFHLEIMGLWVPKVLVWRLVAPCSRVLGRDHPNPRILEVLWEKTLVGENKHGIHKNYMVL